MNLSGIINQIAQEQPILVDKYITGKEMKVHAICDGTDVVESGVNVSKYPCPQYRIRFCTVS